MDKPPITIVVARAQNGVIGRDGKLPWHLPADLKRFKALTMGKPLILGRRTFESLRRPLPGREVIVVTRDPRFSPAGAKVAHSPLEALAVARRLAKTLAVDEIVVGGGAEIFRALMNETQRIELTEIALEPEGDAFFPSLDKARWREIKRETPPRGEKDEADFAFVTLARE